LGAGLYATCRGERLLVITFPHFHIVEPTSWLDVSRVLSSQTTTAVTFEWEKPSFIDF